MVVVYKYELFIDFLVEVNKLVFEEGLKKVEFYFG